MISVAFIPSTKDCFKGVTAPTDRVDHAIKGRTTNLSQVGIHLQETPNGFPEKDDPLDGFRNIRLKWFATALLTITFRTRW